MLHNEIVVALFAALVSGQPPPDPGNNPRMTTPAQRQQARLARLSTRPAQQPVVLAQATPTIDN